MRTFQPTEKVNSSRADLAACPDERTRDSRGSQADHCSRFLASYFRVVSTLAAHMVSQDPPGRTVSRTCVEAQLRR